MIHLVKHTIFSVPLFTTYLKEMDKINKELIRKGKKLQKENKGRIVSNEGGFQSNPIERDDVIKIFYDKIHKDVLEYIKLYNLKDNLNLGFSKPWININPPGSFNWSHHHDGVFSFVYYIDVPKNSGDILFESPHKFSFLKYAFDVFTSLNSLTHTITPEKNMLLMFPGELWHRVMPNKSKQSRISMSFNLYVEK